MTPTPAARAAAITARGLAGPSKNLRPPGESKRLAMHCTAAGAGVSPRSRMIVSGWPMPVRPQAPMTPSLDEPLEQRPDVPDKGLVEGHPARRVRAAGDVRRIGNHVRVQKKEVKPRQSQPFEAALDRAPHDPLDLVGGRLAEIAFAGDADPGREPAAEGLADHRLGLAVAIARGEIDQVDPGLDRGVHGGEAFLEIGLAPQHAEPAAAQGQGRDRGQPAKAALLHRPIPPSAAFSPARRNAGARSGRAPRSCPGPWRRGRRRACRRRADRRPCWNWASTISLA